MSDHDADPLQDRARRAEQVAATLIGLDVEAARAEVARHDELWVRFAEAGTPVTADFGFGRITATTQDGRVIAASAG
ncbi:hypothetical protein [Jatrophihabitans fulvus]